VALAGAGEAPAAASKGRAVAASTARARRASAAAVAALDGGVEALEAAETGRRKATASATCASVRRAAFALALEGGDGWAAVAEGVATGAILFFNQDGREFGVLCVSLSARRTIYIGVEMVMGVWRSPTSSSIMRVLGEEDVAKFFDVVEMPTNHSSSVCSDDRLGGTMIEWGTC